MINALIVEDESDIRELLADDLEDRGCKVQQADNGLVALGRVLDTTPDIIFVDVMMPVMDGFELVTRLRELPETRNVPVVLVTSVNARGTHQRARELDIRHHITKPWQPWALDAVLLEVIKSGEPRSGDPSGAAWHSPKITHK